MLVIQAKYDDALAAYHNAQAPRPFGFPEDLARLHRKTGIVFREKRLYQQALESCFQAEQVLGDHPGGDSGRWWDEWIEVQVDQVWAHYWLANWMQMEALVNQLKPVVNERVKPFNRMRLLWASCLMQLRKDRYVVSQEMLEDSCEVFALSREWGDMKTRIESQFELGFLHLWRHELEEAEKNLLAALELTEKYGGITQTKPQIML